MAAIARASSIVTPIGGAAPRRCASSAGRNASRCSSASVTSAAVANDVSVVMRRRSPSAEASSSGTAKPSTSASARQRRQVALELGEQLLQRRVRAAHELGPQVLGDVPAPLRQVANPGREAVGVEGEAEHVGRRRQQRRVDAFVEHVERPVGGDEDAVRPHDHRRVREVAVEDRVQRLANRAERLVVERRLRERRGEAGGEQQLVALPQRELHRLRQPHDHAAPRAGATLFDEAHVPLGRARPHRQVELAQPAGRAPAPQLVREPGRHHDDRRPPRASMPFPPGSCWRGPPRRTMRP